MKLIFILCCLKFLNFLWVMLFTHYLFSTFLNNKKNVFSQWWLSLSRIIPHSHKKSKIKNRSENKKMCVPFLYKQVYHTVWTWKKSFWYSETEKNRVEFSEKGMALATTTQPTNDGPLIAEVDMGSDFNAPTVRATVVQASTIFYDTPATLGTFCLSLCNSFNNNCYFSFEKFCALPCFESVPDYLWVLYFGCR